MIPTNLLLYIGVALLLGFLLGRATNWLRITAIVGYIIAGIILGPIMNKLMEPTLYTDTMNLVVDVTLGFVGFIIGIGFTKGFIKRFGKVAISIALIESAVTFAILLLGTYLLTKDIILGLIFGVIGLATAPAGTVAAIHMAKGRGDLSRLTVAIVGVDDGIAIVFFVIVLAAVKFLLGEQLSFFELISIPIIEIGAAVLLGVLFGSALAYLGRFIKDREDIFIISLSFIFTCIGICEIVGASSILACMIFGIIFINTNPQVGRTVNSNIESVLPPIFVIFFAIAGLELSIRYNFLVEFGFFSIIGIVIVYIIYRILGKIAGAFIAGKTMKTSEATQKYLGFALLSQAGVNIGLAILLSNELASHADGMEIGALVISIITITTIFFEILGPIGVKYALTKAGEAYISK